VVLDSCTRRVVGWSIDSSQTGAVVTSALDMAIGNRTAQSGVVIHSDHGGAIHILRVNRPGPRLRAAALYGLRRRLLGNAMIESTLGRGQAGLLNRRRWRTRLELADALFEYLEIYCNRRRRHSALGMLTPIEYELRINAAQPEAWPTLQHSDSGKLRAHH